MKKKLQLTEQAFDQFEDYLRHDEREESTIEAYLRSLTRFAEWAEAGPSPRSWPWSGRRRCPSPVIAPSP